MALKFSAWVAAATVSCAVVWYGLSDIHPKRTTVAHGIIMDWDPNPTQRASFIAERQLADANDRFWLLTLRDSVLREQVTKSSDSLTVLVDRGIAMLSSFPVDSVIRAQWHALDIKPLVPVTLALVVDDNWSPGGLPRSRRYDFGAPIDVFLPSVETHGRCVSLAHITVPSRAPNLRATSIRYLATPETFNALIGPCALIAQFGQPGPRIREWLRNAQWSTARLAVWESAPKPWTSVVRANSPYGPRGPNFMERTDPTWQVRDFIGPKGIACLAGEPGACQRAALAVPPLNSDTAWRDHVIATSGVNPRAFFAPRYVTPLGPAEPWVVSEMVRTLGRDSFGKFWRSPLPVDSAFSAASGRSLDAWVRAWGQRMYGDAAVGPGVPFIGVATGTVVLLLGVVASVIIERKRRVA